MRIWGSNISIVEPSGEVGRFEGQLLLKNILNLIQHRWKKIVLDLGEVEHIHYRVLAELGTVLSESDGQVGTVKLANLNSYHRELLKVAGVDHFFETYDSVAEAVLSFESPLSQACNLQ